MLKRPSSVVKWGSSDVGFDASFLEDSVEGPEVGENVPREELQCLGALRVR
jgi:hypothetical protein